MIKSLWEWGYLMNHEEKEMGYGISIILDSDERKDFSGKDINIVRDQAMDFICKHYYANQHIDEQLPPIYIKE